MTFTLFTTYLTAETATASALFEKLFTGRSREWNLAPIAGGSNITTKEFSTPRLMSTILIIIKFDVENKENERDDKKE